LSWYWICRGDAGPEPTCNFAGRGGSGSGLSANRETNNHVQARAPPNPMVVARKTHAKTRATFPGSLDAAIL
jgi:hypothetical protein